MKKKKKTTTVKPSSEPVRILNLRPSQDTENDWLFHNAGLAAYSVPATVDLRAPWWTIGDQGATGSCVGWACADGVIRWCMVKAGRLVQSQSEPLSPRFLWIAAKETDIYNNYPSTFIESEGTSLKAALDIARKFGTILASFIPSDGYRGEAETFYATAAKRKIASYFRLTTAEQMRTWIATKGPLLTGLEVDATWDRATATAGRLATYKPATVRGGHAVAIVGYTPTTFIVRNSWGTGWGDKGFAYASNAYAKAAFLEVYGVTVS